MNDGLPSPAEPLAIDAYWHGDNYPSVGPIHLLDNSLLRQPLTLQRIKPHLLEHWGSTRGLNFIYAHLNRVIKLHDLDMIFITGQGHVWPSVIAPPGVNARRQEGPSAGSVSPDVKIGYPCGNCRSLPPRSPGISTRGNAS